MNPKAKRYFALRRTKRGIRIPKKITYTSVEQKPVEVKLNKLLQLRRYADYKLIKQITDYQSKRIKEEKTRHLNEIPKLELWMLTSSQSKLGFSLLNKIRNYRAKVSLALYAVFFFYLPVYAGNVTGRVVENGSTYGVPSVKVELFVNGNLTPSVTYTDAQGYFSNNPLGIRESSSAQLSTLEIASGPNPGATQTLRFNIPVSGNVELYVIELATGEKVKTLHKSYTNAGTYIVDWNGINEHGQRVSDGRYAYVLRTNDESRIIKTIINKNEPLSTGIEYTLKKDNPGTAGIEIENWQLDSVRFSASNIETKTLSGFQPQTGDLDIGIVAVEGTNVITGYAYDLWTKYNNRTGIPNLVVKLKSIPNKIITTNQNGLFIYKTTRNGADSLIITSDQYYNWKHPINITPFTDVKAFNDITGIPMIPRYEEIGIIPVLHNGTQWIDSLATDDLIEFTQNITNVRHQWLENPIYKNTVPRLKNGLVYLNRANAPVGYYIDSVWAGMKAQENEQLIFIETLDSAAATIRMKYTNPNVGNIDEVAFAFDAQGPYIDYWVINLRGPPGSTQALRPEWVAPVVAHEIEHAIFSSGELSPFITDILYGDPLSYYERGYPTTGSQKEILARKIISFLERNPKLLEYYK